MANFLQGRAGSPYAPAISEFTTPADLQRERLSNVFGWDVGRPGQEFARRALTQLPLAMRPAMGGMPARPAAAPAAASPEPGPWAPGHMETWLQGRYQPAARPQEWPADRRWGSTAPQATRWDKIAQAHHDFMYPGLGRPPKTLDEHVKVALRQVPRAYGAAAGVTGGNIAVDTIYRGEPWQTASWRRLAGRSDNPPPSWWPQPPPDERPLPPSGPMPPSQLRSGW